jgi:hypothetical protein
MKPSSALPRVEMRSIPSTAWRGLLVPLLLGVLLRGLFFIWNAHECGTGGSGGRWAAWDPDQWEYIGTTESYLAGTGWQPDHRMPGYAFIYLIFRSLFAAPQACDAITVVQMLVSVLATYAFCRALATVFGRPRLFWPAYLISLIGVYSALSDVVLVNESFTTSALMLHWASYVRSRITGYRLWLLGSGAMIALAIFLRPVYGPILVLVPLFELVQRDVAWRFRLLNVLVVCLPFVLVDSVWVIRNHSHYGGFHPLTNHGSWNPRYVRMPHYAATELVSTFGGHAYYWEPSSDMRWYGFEADAGGGTERSIPGVEEPPDYAYTSVCTRDSLVHFANTVRAARRLPALSAGHDSLITELLGMAQRWREVYARERPFRYHIVSRLQLLKHQSFTSGSQVLFKRPVSELNFIERAFKVLQSALYWWALAVGGLAGLVALMRPRSSGLFALLGAMATYSVLACPWLMRAAEIRYMIPVFPLLLGLSVWAGAIGWQRWGAARWWAGRRLAKEATT